VYVYIWGRNDVLIWVLHMTFDPGSQYHVYGQLVTMSRHFNPLYQSPHCVKCPCIIFATRGVPDRALSSLFQLLGWIRIHISNVVTVVSNFTVLVAVQRFRIKRSNILAITDYENSCHGKVCARARQNRMDSSLHCSCKCCHPSLKFWYCFDPC